MPPRIGFSGKLTKVCCAMVDIGWWLALDLTRAARLAQMIRNRLRRADGKFIYAAKTIR